LSYIVEELGSWEELIPTNDTLYKVKNLVLIDGIDEMAPSSTYLSEFPTELINFLMERKLNAQIIFTLRDPISEYMDTYSETDINS